MLSEFPVKATICLSRGFMLSQTLVTLYVKENTLP